jgi:DNA-binding IclR family transcriptional regulator
MIPSTSPRRVQSVETGFEIITILQNQDGATIDELAARLDLAKSTVHNYLGTLHELGYVVKRDGTYQPGLRFLTHGMAAKSRFRAGDLITEALSMVSEETTHHVWWIVEELGRGIFLDFASVSDTQPYGRIGKRSYLHAHAPGKAILASLTPEEFEQVVEHHGLPSFTLETITDVDDLAAQLDQIREKGYAVSEGEASLNIRSVGVAFDGPEGSRHGLGVFGYAHEFQGKPEADIATTLQEAADEIADGLAGQELINV